MMLARPIHAAAAGMHGHRSRPRLEGFGADGRRYRQTDRERGAVIAAQGTAAGAPACAQCHAFNGASDGSGAFPRIAGQSANYLAKQMRDFSVGCSRQRHYVADRQGADAGRDRRRGGLLCRSSPLPSCRCATADPALIKRGEELAKVGSASSGIQACDNCHGPGGAGEPPAIPYLAGQYAPYIALRIADVAARLPQEQSRGDGRGGKAAQRSGDRGSRRLLSAGPGTCRTRGIGVGDIMSTASHGQDHVRGQPDGTRGRADRRRRR